MCIVSMKDIFWQSLRRETASVSKKEHFLILGDLNATTSAIAPLATYFCGQDTVDFTANDNGHRLARFLAEHKGHVASTFFSHKPVHAITWYSNDQKTRKILDVATHDRFLQRACPVDSRVRRSIDTASHMCRSRPVNVY